MDKNNKNACNLPNCGSHVKETHLDDLYREKISNSIRIGFEFLSNSLVECALILSSEDYAKSLVKEREAKKEKEEAKKKEDEKDERKIEKTLNLYEESEKILDLYKEKLKDQIYSTNLPDHEKGEIFYSLISNEPFGGRSIQSIRNCINVSQFVKKAFCSAIKEVKPYFGSLIVDETMNFDPMLLAMIIPNAIIPPLSLMALTSSDGKFAHTNPILNKKD